MGSWQALTLASDGPLWDSACERLPNADVYFTRGYHAAYEAIGDGRATAFVHDDGRNLFFYPFMCRPITAVGSIAAPLECQDIETVYGYSGPLCTTDDPRFLGDAWAGFAAYCRRARVVAEFSRFHPYAENHDLLGPGCTVVLDRHTVSIDLRGTEQEFWERYPHGQRSTIRQAQALGLAVAEMDPAHGMGVFKEIYRINMRHVDARPYYFFEDDYFDALRAGLGPSLRVFVVQDAGRCVAAGLFLWSRDVIHYHLGGSLPDARHLRPNNLLFHEVARWGRDRSCRSLHLGGGRTARADDALFRFKASFSRERRCFYTGRRVHDAEAVAALSTLWREQANGAAEPDYFLLYRAPLPERHAGPVA